MQRGGSWERWGQVGSRAEVPSPGHHLPGSKVTQLLPLPSLPITQPTWSSLWASVPSLSRLSMRLSPLLARVAPEGSSWANSGP